MNGKRLAVLVLCSALISCGGSDSGNTGSATSNGRLNIVPETVNLNQGASKEVLFELVGSQGLVNQSVRFRVADPTQAHVAPASCVLSSGSSETSRCVLTVTGKTTGAAQVFAEADGYDSDSALITVTVGNGYGTLSVTPTTATSQTYYRHGQTIPFSITVLFSPTVGGKTIPQSNPLYVSMSQPAGSPFTFTAQQCALWTASPTCIISGTLDGTKAPSIDFTSTISVVGAWQAPPEAPFGPADNMTIKWLGTAEQQAGRITVVSQNGSNQVYMGMKAPLFVNLAGNTLTTSNYNVTITSNDPSSLVFYAFDDGNNTSPHTMTSVTCRLSLDNTSQQSISNSVTSCGYGMSPTKSGSVSLAVSVSSTSATPKLPSYESTVTVMVTDSSTLSTGRTVSFTNNSADTIVVNANSGTANAFTSATSVASGGDSTNPAKSVAGAQSQCGPTNPANACPIGSSCVQGGAKVTVGGGTPFYCYWDAPQFTSASQTVPANNVPPNSSASLFIPSWSGITAGPQQVQWSGNYYVQKCDNGNRHGVCPTSPATPGTGSSYAAQTLAEVTYQHNAVDYYDVSIINGANYAIQFGPKATEMTPDTTNAYTCGTAGSMTPMSGNLVTNPKAHLPASSWGFSPAASNFPPASGMTGSPSSYYAVVKPNSTTPTACIVQADCSGGATSGPRCGWDYTTVLNGTSNDFSSRVCGTFYSWATANQIHGWNDGTSSTKNNAPFRLRASFTVDPKFKSQSSVSVGDLQLCVNNTYSAYTNPAPIDPGTSVVVSAALACGGTNWDGVTRPSTPYTTKNVNWVDYVLPTISWLKAACPTCYTFPYDDMSATFTCEKGLNAQGSNMLDYTVKVNDLSNTFN